MNGEPRLISIKYIPDETDSNRESNNNSFANDVEKSTLKKSHIEHFSTDVENMKNKCRLISINYLPDEIDFNRESNNNSFDNDLEENRFKKSHIEHSSTDSSNMIEKSRLISLDCIPTDFNAKSQNTIEENILKKSHIERGDHENHINLKEKRTIPEENPSTDSIEELTDIIPSIYINSIKFQIFAKNSQEYNIFGKAYKISDDFFVNSTDYNSEYSINELVEFKLEEADENEIDTKTVNNSKISAWKTENIFKPKEDANFTKDYTNKPHSGLVHDETDNPHDSNCIKFNNISSKHSVWANIFVPEQSEQNIGITIRKAVSDRKQNYNIFNDDSQWPPLQTPSSFVNPVNEKNAAKNPGEPKLISVRNISENIYSNTESHQKIHTNIQRELQQERIEKSITVPDVNEKITPKHIEINKKRHVLKETDNSPNVITRNCRTDILYISEPKQVNKIVENEDNFHKNNKGQLKGIVKESLEPQDKTIKHVSQKIKDNSNTVNDKREISDDYRSSMEKNIQIIINKTHFVIDEYAYNTIVFLGDNIKHCFVCSTYIYHGCMHEHMVSDEHSKNISNYKFLDTYTKHLIRQKCFKYHCAICNVVIGHGQLMNHLEWKIHQHLSIQCKTKKSVRNSTKIIKAVTQKEQKYLNTIVPKTKIFLHVRIVATLNTTDKMENKKVILNGRIFTIGFYNWHGICKSNKNIFNCIICKEEVSGDVVEHCNGHYTGVLNNILEEYLPALIRQINGTLAHCVICNTGLLNIEGDILDHVSVKKHTKNYNELFKKSTALTTSEYDEFGNKITVKIL